MVMDKTTISVQELSAQMGISLPKAYTRQNVWMVIEFRKSKSSGIVSVNFKHRHHINKNGIVQ